MMRQFRLAELAAPLDARLLGSDQPFARVSTDSRTLQAGDLFVALVGDRFNGHDYLPQVQAGHAAGALVSQPFDGDIAQLQVADTLTALGRLGAYNRSFYHGPLVGITGSSGKTSVKNMVRAVLEQAGNTLATEGNFNNEIGVPLTLLRLHPEVDYAVVEMGAGRIGDIAWLRELGRPTISVLVNAGPAHLETFGTIDDVAQGKGEIFDGLGAGDYAVINADQRWAAQWRKRAGQANILDFGLHNAAAISASNISVRGSQGVSFTASTPEGEIAIRLGLPGQHNVANALAAIAAGLACGLHLTQIRDGLESLQPVAGRLRSLRTPAGSTVIDDCYNANPGSVRAAIEVLASCDGRRTLILGAMLELGDDSVAMHREIGRYAAELGLDGFWGVGQELQPAVEAFGSGGQFFADRQAAVDAVPASFGEHDTVLVKGSRSSKMEQVLQAMTAAGEQGEPPC
jgi:UDP-N-acetylmuramoyl-tripeptide--D-alanyl-D-alanine ligase